MPKRVIITITVILGIALISLGVIFYARGFKINPKNGGLERTGLLVIDSIPEGAQVFLDDRLTSATNTTISFLKPKTYHLKLTKEGYNPWEKDIEIKADLANKIDVVLFPSLPELKPLTYAGAKNPVISPDGNKIVYAVTGEEKAGLWILEISGSPFPFRSAQRQIVKNTPTLDFSQAKLTWSPDSQTIWASLQKGGVEGEENTRNFFLEAGKLNENLVDVTATLEAKLTTWQTDINRVEQERLKGLEKLLTENSEVVIKAKKIFEQEQATSSAALGVVKLYPDNLIWSPDEKKILIPKEKNGGFSQGANVWLLKDNNPLIKTPNQFEIPAAKQIFWYPNSENLVLVEDDKIQIIDFEGINKVTVYSGSFEDNFVFTWSDGSRLVILTTLNQAAGAPANLYSVNLR